MHASYSAFSSWQTEHLPAKIYFYYGSVLAWDMSLTKSKKIAGANEASPHRTGGTTKGNLMLGKDRAWWVDCEGLVSYSATEEWV